MAQFFATEIYRSTVKFDLKDLKKEIFQIRKVDQNGQKWSAENYPCGYTSYGSMDQLHRLSSTFEALQAKLDLHVNKYLKTLSYDARKGTLKLNSMWINVMETGAQHTAHIHPHSVISGTYYVDVPAGASAIRFEDPRLGLFMNSPLVKASAPASKQRFVSLNPKAGEVVLFESWLKHEVPRHTGRRERISISFNYDW